MTKPVMERRCSFCKVMKPRAAYSRPGKSGNLARLCHDCRAKKRETYDRIERRLTPERWQELNFPLIVPLGEQKSR